MSFNEDMEDGLAEIEGDVTNPDGSGMTFTWSGTAYPCTGSVLNSSKDLGEGGWNTQSDLVRNIRRSFFIGPSGALPMPQLKQTGVDSFTGKTLRIDGIDYSPGFIKLTLIDPTKGA
jgi:hypothetical protein